MNYTVLYDSHKASGSSYRGALNISYSQLVDVFGEPENGNGDKTQKEWTIEFEDGKIATIYDWKWCYDGVDYTEVPTWHIGGHDDVVVERITTIVKEYQTVTNT